MIINLFPFILIAFTTLIGLALGSWLIGAIVGLGIVLLAHLIPGSWSR